MIHWLICMWWSQNLPILNKCFVMASLSTAQALFMNISAKMCDRYNTNSLYAHKNMNILLPPSKVWRRCSQIRGSECGCITYVGVAACEMQSYQTIWSSWEETLHKRQKTFARQFITWKGTQHSPCDYMKRIMLFVLLKIFACRG